MQVGGIGSLRTCVNQAPNKSLKPYNNCSSTRGSTAIDVTVSARNAITVKHLEESIENRNQVIAMDGEPEVACIVDSDIPAQPGA